MTAQTAKNSAQRGHSVRTPSGFIVHDRPVRCAHFNDLLCRLGWDDQRASAKIGVSSRSVKRWRLGQVEPPVLVLRFLRSMALLTAACPTAATLVTSHAETLEGLAAMPTPIRLAYEAGRGVPTDGDTGLPYGSDAGEYL